MLITNDTLVCLLDSIHWKDMGKSKAYRDVFTQQRSYNGISLSANKGLHVRWANERTKFIIRGGKSHVNDMHIQDM